MQLIWMAMIALGMGEPSSESVQIVVPSGVAIESEAVERALLPMKTAIDDERNRQDRLGPPTSDAERLVRMGRLDQTARRSLQNIDLSGLPEAEARAARGRALGLMHEIDLQNVAQFRTITPVNGWFNRSDYGDEASRAAFLIVQHADEDLMRRYLPFLEPLVGTGEIEDAQYALMYDRVAVDEGRLQRYGSQFQCVGRESRLAALEDPDNVDARRATMGMISMADNARRFERGNPCQFSRGQ